MAYIDSIKEKARKDKKTIVLPESNDKRTLIAASHILEEGIADIIMVGDEEKIMDGAGWLEIELDGVTVSSTHIRGLVERGELEEAGRFLGHPFVLSGPVVHGSELGRTLGTPTANLLIPQGVIAPGFGVYAAKVRVLPDDPGRQPSRPEEGPYLAVTNVGVRPTVNPALSGVTVEPWILDFAGDLYGRTLRLELYRRLRLERRFSGVDELRSAILENAAQTRAYFAAKERASC